MWAIIHKEIWMRPEDPVCRNAFQVLQRSRNRHVQRYRNKHVDMVRVHNNLMDKNAFFKGNLFKNLFHFCRNERILHAFVPVFWTPLQVVFVVSDTMCIYIFVVPTIHGFTSLRPNGRIDIMFDKKE